ncbi:MAG: hypothetical protein GXP55_19690 [Deltaproteobacteria bacterium]|nr:hypothetical protein [Deltaproteobacteria bacterium]
MRTQTVVEDLWERLTPRFLSRLGLRSRFMVTAAFAIALFGLVNLVVFDAVAAHVVSHEVRDRALTLSRRLAVEAGRLVLLEDRAGLHRLLIETRRTDTLCDYALVISPSGEVFASTFENGVPIGLAEIANTASAGPTTRVVADRSERYLDVAAPILDGELGVLRLGARMDRIRSGAAQVRMVGIIMVAAFLVLGMVGAYLTAHLVAAPVERLAARVREFDPTVGAAEGSSGTDSSSDGGEVGELIQSYEAMAARLRQMHQEEEAFRSRIVRAERLATAGALAAGVAHDVNNPLAGIRNCLRAMERAPEDIEQTQMYTPMMMEATHSIERAVRGLMDFASRSAPMPESVNMARLAERTALLVRHQFRGCRLELELESSELRIETDPALAQQVLVNLLLNACDASPPGGRVTLALKRAELGITLDVIDRGTGIPADLVEHIWEPFVTTKQDRGGTGLGLAMVKSIVADLDGEIWVDTEQGQGTRFRVSLPDRGTSVEDLKSSEPQPIARPEAK